MTKMPPPPGAPSPILDLGPIAPQPTFPYPRRPWVVASNNVRLTVERPLKELNIVPNTTRAAESPVRMVAGETRTFTLVFQGVTAVTNPSAAVYKGGTGSDLAGTVMPSGSHSASGNTATLKPLTSLTAGETYTVAVTATCDGDTRIVKFAVFAEDPKTP